MYSDEQKKSVFLLSSSNDEFVQSQLSNKLSQFPGMKNSQKNFRNANGGMNGGLT